MVEAYGIEVAKSTVEKYRVRPSKPPSPTWRTFLATHAKDLVSIDFFTVATVRFEILFVLIILAHDRRRVRHFNITAHPTAEWTVQQMVEAFPWDTAPDYLLRDRASVYGTDFRQRVAALGIEEVLSAPRKPRRGQRRHGNRSGTSGGVALVVPIADAQCSAELAANVVLRVLLFWVPKDRFGRPIFHEVTGASASGGVDVQKTGHVRDALRLL